MNKIKRVIRMRSNGSSETGMGMWNNLNHENIISGDARDRTHEVFSKDMIENSRVRVGVWEAKAYKEKLVDYPCNEFMYVIEGSCSIVEADGNRVTFTRGDSFFMPSGFNGYWEQTEPMKKYYMIVEST